MNPLHPVWFTHALKRVAIAALALALPASAQSIRSIHPFELLPRAANFDGSVVVGDFLSFQAPVIRPFRVSRSSSGSSFEFLALPSETRSGRAYDVSADGETVVGSLGSDGFVWTRAGGYSDYTPFGAGVLAGLTGVSADGSVVAGNTVVNNLSVPYRALLGGVAQVLADPFGGSSNCFALSGDGMSLVGQAYQSIPIQTCPGNAIQHGYVWGPAGGVLGGAQRRFAVSVSHDGSTIVGGGCDFQPPDANGCLGGCMPSGPQAFIWSGGEQQFVAGAGEYLFFYAVSGDGRTVGGSIYTNSTAEHRAVIWRAGLGLMDLDDYLDDLGVDHSLFRVRSVTALSYDGMVIAGQADHFEPGSSAWVRQGFIADIHKDTDGDGIYDDWESEGIPYLDSSSHVQRYMLPGADPYRKDIYVEVDAMTGCAPAQASLDQVIAAFDTAPVPAAGPGVLPGITLHASVDESNLPPRTYTGNRGWDGFRADKAVHFGTVAERNSPNWQAIRRTKALVYRYCIYAQSLPESLGIGELDSNRPPLGPRMGGNDLVLGLAGYIPPPTVNIADVHATAFMHELGHTLGLFHGGAFAYQNINPNDYSVMNYTWAGTREYAPAGRRIHLDYSRQNLPILDTDSLNEFAGMGSDFFDIRVPIVVRKPGLPHPCGTDPRPNPDRGTCTVPITAQYCFNYAPLGGSVDWNNDGFISDPYHPVCAHPNGSTSGQTLWAVNEWNLLAYNFRDSPYFEDAALALDSDPCPTAEYEFFMSSLPPPPPLPMCTGVPPVPGSPFPPMAVACESGGEVSIDPQGHGPFRVRWRLADPAQPTIWTDLAEGTLPHGTRISGAGHRALTISQPDIADFPSGFGLISCVVTDACGLSAPSDSIVILPASFSVSETTPLINAVCVGSNFVAQVAAQTNLSDISYQWTSIVPYLRLDDGPMPGGTIIQGSHTPTLSIYNARAEDTLSGTFLFRCEVTSAICGTRYSQDFFFTTAGVLLTEEPTGIQLPCAGAPSHTLHAAAVGGAPLSYRWKRNGVDLADGGHLSGSGTPDLTIAPLDGTDGGEYACLITAACGQSVAALTTTPAVINVGPPRMVVDPPAPAFACINSFTEINSSVTGSQPLSYQWFKGSVPLTDDDRVFGSQYYLLSIFPVQPSDLGQYSVRVTNACGQTTSLPTTLAFYPEFVFTQQPADGLTCAGGTRALTAQVNAPEHVNFYAWQVEYPEFPDAWIDPEGNGPLLANLGGCTTVTGVYTPTLSVATPTGTSCLPSHRFRLRVSTPCGEIYSDPATLTLCSADVNCSGTVSVQDIFDFLALYFTGDAGGDYNASGATSVQDIFDFLAGYFLGCS